MTRVPIGVELRIRDLRPKDLEQVVRIDALHTGESKLDYWRGVFRSFLRKRADGPGRVGLAAEIDGGVVGYLLGEVRAFEFGSEPCGWVFAVGVDTDHLRSGIASGLLSETAGRFKRAGVRTMRTMMRRDDVPVMSFFRFNGFVGGTFVQLERDLGEEQP